MLRPQAPWQRGNASGRPGEDGAARSASCRGWPWQGLAARVRDGQDAGVVSEVGTLGAYLRARRARVDVQDTGLPCTGTRRTAGLRREEVAVLAGVSVDYYTRLERGRDQRPSAQVVAALARALRLSADEAAHLHLLAGLPSPGRTAQLHVRPQTHALLAALHPTPAYVLSPASDVLAWNPAMARVLLDFSTVPDGERNIVRLTFLDPQVRRVWSDWQATATEAVANLRAAAARYPHDPHLIDLVGELSIRSDEFARLWGQHEVKDKRGGRKHLQHPEVGALALDYEVLASDRDEQRLVAFLPADASTATALHRLLDRQDPTGTASRRADLRALG